jgi:hypothetical protein
MAIRSDSFSSVVEVMGFTRHLLDGKVAFDDYTRPTKTEIEKFIDRASGVLNVALSSKGFSPSAVYLNSTAKLACDDWVTQKAVKYTELTQRGTGYSDEEGSRTKAFSMNEDACEFVDSMALGLINLGISQSRKLSDGLAFTGMGIHSDRSDIDDTTKEQPLFTRHGFDNE